MPSFRVAALQMTDLHMTGFDAPSFFGRHIGAAGLIGVDMLEERRVLIDFRKETMEILETRKRARPIIRDDDAIVVTGTMRAPQMMRSAVVTAEEEDLGDLKLFRVPGRVDVSAKGMKQVAFLNKDAVKARYLYQAGNCDPWDWIKTEDAEDEDFVAANLLLVTKNEEKKGLGIALPQGAMTLYEPTSRGPQLAAQVNLRDYARGQDIELELGTSAQVFVRCGGALDDAPPDGPKWTKMRVRITNANPHTITMRLRVGYAGEYDIRFPRRTVEVKNGYQTVEVTVPANSEGVFDWQHREATDQ